MFQSELFIPAALEYKEKGLRQLDELDFKAAAESFIIAKEIDPYLADLDFLILHKIDLQTLQHAELRVVLEVLKREAQDENWARAVWPVHAWMKGVVQIPRGNTFLLPLARKQRSILGSELMLEPAQRARQFSQCLYIDQSGLHGEIQFDARAEMQNLDPEMFSRYLQEVERRAQAGPR